MFCAWTIPDQTVSSTTLPMNNEVAPSWKAFEGQLPRKETQDTRTTKLQSFHNVSDGAHPFIRTAILLGALIVRQFGGLVLEAKSKFSSSQEPAFLNSLA